MSEEVNLNWKGIEFLEWVGMQVGKGNIVSFFWDRDNGVDLQVSAFEEDLIDYKAQGFDNPWDAMGEINRQMLKSIAKLGDK